MKKVISILIAFLGFQAGAANLPLTLQSAHQDQGERFVLAAQTGRTLYTFTPDALNQSNCKDACAKKWPPVTVAPEEAKLLTGVLSTISRDDGSKQLTVAGQPVYFYAGDQSVGDINGEGLGDVWFVLDLNIVRKK
jgi:predicted lipoprotein with Yx(FWY)xxD motif